MMENLFLRYVAGTHNNATGAESLGNLFQKRICNFPSTYVV
jgi:hypothetical protein